MDKVKPLLRQEIQKLLATDADAFTVFRYLRHREAVPSLPDLEIKGHEALPGVEGALCDLYYSLWDPEPSVKEEVVPDRQYWKEMLSQTIQTAAFQELHAQTQLKELQSILGTIAMGESIIATVPKEDQEKLQELGDASADAETKADEAQEAEQMAQVAQQIADAAAQQANGQGQSQGQGQTNGQQSGQQTGGMTSEQAKEIANQLAAQAAAAKANAATAKQQAEDAKAKAVQLAQALMGQPDSQQAKDKQRELARIGIQALKQAQAKVEEVSETIEAWGLEEGELTQQGIPETLDLLKRMSQNEAFKKFAILLGRVRKIADRKACSKVSGEGVKITKPETGRDIKRAQRGELVALTNPALRAKALTRWSRGELRLVGQETKEKLGHGPVIVCEDGSGSMDGEKQQFAKATVLAMAHYAKIQRRSFAWILYDSRVRVYRVYLQGQMTGTQMLEIAEAQAGGGTNFEEPLNKAMEIIQKEGLKKADICFITDGDCEVSDNFLKEFSTVKKKLEVNVISVLCDVGHTTDKTLNQFSDRVDRVSQFTAETAEQVFRGM